MKRTATTLALLAGFGGGCTSTDASKQATVGGYGTATRGKAMPGLQGPGGEPVMAARGAAPGGSAVEPALFRKAGTPSAAEIMQTAYVPGLGRAGKGCATCGDGGGAPMAAGGYGGGPGYGPPMGGPYGPGYPPSGQGILPVPGQGPPGAVAGVGALVPGMGGAGTGALANGRASVNFTGPAGMKITWQLPGGGFNPEGSGLTAPAPYNFVQGQVYRLRLTQILPNHPGRAFYPTLEIAAANPKTLTFLAHTSVPVTFTNEDFDQAGAGNLVVKVIYLPDRENQDFATVAGAEELVSTRLEPGADPVAEAQRRGSVLAIVRLGNIDLENKASPAMTAPPGSMMPPAGGPMMIPGPMGPGMPGMPGMGAMPPGPMTPSRPGVPPSPPSQPGVSSVPSGPIAPGPLPLGRSPATPTMLPPIK